MKIYAKYLKLLFILVFAILIINNCKDDDNRGEFSWKGKIEGHIGDFTIKCDDGCERCSTTLYEGAGIYKEYILSKTDYNEIYEKCANLPPSGNNVSDTKNVTPTGKVAFLRSLNMEYGFDNWTNENTTDKASYISVAAGCSTAFNINVGGNMLSAKYDAIKAVIPDAAKNKIYFNRITAMDTISLHDSINKVWIYARSDAPVGNPVYVNVYGIDDPSSPACIAGNCNQADDVLKIVVYNEIVYDSVYLYLVGNTVFNPSIPVWNFRFNSLLKQAVLKMDGYKKVNFPMADIDVNGNSIFDWIQFANLLEAPPGWLERDEYYRLMFYSDNADQGCEKDERNAIFIPQGRVRQHYIMVNDPGLYNGEYRYLYLYGGRYISPGSVLKIGRYGAPTIYEEIEALALISTSPSADVVLIGLLGDIDKGLQYEHKAAFMETVFSDSLSAGITYSSCSCLSDQPKDVTLVHEFLHQNKSGGLLDVDTIIHNDNIMYGYSTNGRAYLRYRAVPVIQELGSPGTQEQWNVLHQR